MSVLYADLVGPLPEGKNSKNQREFQYILSVVDSATRYLWLLPLRHKTADDVAVALYDDVITRAGTFRDTHRAGWRVHGRSYEVFV